MKQSLLFILIFLFGVLCGQNGFTSFITADLLPILLALLLFLIGWDIGCDEIQWKRLKKLPLHGLSLPLITIAGTILGAAVASLFLPNLYLRESVLASSGLGYYSLSSVLLSVRVSSIVGTLALLSNIFRESITLVAAPLIVRWFGPRALIITGAATTMDVTLPTIQKYAGKEWVYPAFVSGIFTTLSIPLLIEVLINIL